MSSRGPQIAGTDGNDFRHRQTIASHYQTSVVNKSRLSTCLLVQMILFLIIGVKLIDDILDRLEIFVLELQELYIPKPRIWEYVWAVSLIFTLIARLAMTKNSRTLMKVYIAMLISFSLVPVLFASYVYLEDVKNFYIHRDLKFVNEHWQGYPTGVYWYVFLFIVFQLHVAQLCFAFTLMNAWKSRSKRD